MTNNTLLMTKKCEICDVAFQTSFTRQKKCIEHARYYRKICKGCGNEFVGKHSGDNGAQYCDPNCRPRRASPVNIELMMERANELSGIAKQCVKCGADFYPPKRLAHCQKRCSLHTDKGKREIQIVKDSINPCKVASIKNCESTERHAECSGKMLVTATEWKRCAWCARLLTSPIEGL
jgi:hypothetical protein